MLPVASGPASSPAGGRPAGSLPDPQRYLESLLQAALAATSADAGAVLVLFPDSLDPDPDVWAVGVEGDAGRWPSHRLDAWTAAMRRPGRSALRPGVCEHTPADPAADWLLPAAETALCVPLLDQGRHLGELRLEARGRRRFRDDHHAWLAELADEAVEELPRLLLRERGLRDGSQIELIGVSPAFRRMQAQLRQVARCEKTPVLISGERGTGKELAARAVHGWSRRRRGPFVPVLVSALPETLAAAELFGHERSVFTGAETSRVGRFEAAAGGTLFLDEVADIGPGMQSALLRVIENDEISRLGCNQPVKSDARVVAATNRDLWSSSQRGSFREDLLDRLSVLEVELPPLRERREDVSLLADHFLLRACEQLQRRRDTSRVRCRTCGSDGELRCATPEFYEALQAYHWPGNVRELRNLMLRLLAIATDAPLDVHHLPERVRRGRAVHPATVPSAAPAAAPAPAASPAIDLTLEQAVRRHILEVLEKARYNKSETARRLGIPYTTLQSKLKRLGIPVRPPA